MTVQWSKESSSYMYECGNGCEVHDHEGWWEALAAFFDHECPVQEVPC